MIDRARGACLPALLLCAALSGGCAAMTNPVGDGVPVRRLPAEMFVASKKDEQTIPLSCLRQPPPDVYRLARGDVLGVAVEGFLGERNQPLPFHVGQLVHPRDQRRNQAALGYPVPVEEDGGIDLPGAGRLSVRGMSVAEARQAIRDFYISKGLLKPAPETPPVIVTLLQARSSSVLVLRQESSTFTAGPEGQVTAGTSKRGTGFEIDLPAYENDVLHALTRTGGLPGLDAYNQIVIQRGCFRDGRERPSLLGTPGTVTGDQNPLATLGQGGEVIRIPLRVAPGQAPCLRPQDIILNTGDVVFLEARDDAYFYTGGLLPAGAHVLPRDRDLDVLEAVTLVRGPLINGAFGGSNLSGTLIASGVGNPSPTLLTVVRRTPGGGQVPIAVDLRCALRDPAERLLLKPGDLLILQEKPEEAFTRYFTQTFLNFNLAWRVVHNRFANGFIDVSAPDRLPDRLQPNNLNR